jgi:hypothetical protein
MAMMFVGEVVSVINRIFVTIPTVEKLRSANLSRFEDMGSLQVESYISDWQFCKSQHLASYVSRHNVMAYDKFIILYLFKQQRL